MRSAIYQSHGLTSAKAVLAQARFVISDIDGVLFDPTGCPVVGAAKLFASRPCALVSNNSTLTAKTIAKRLPMEEPISRKSVFFLPENMRSALRSSVSEALPCCGLQVMK